MDVDDQKPRIELLDGAARLLHGADRARLSSEVLDGLLESFPGRQIVLDDENLQAVSSGSSRTADTRSPC